MKVCVCTQRPANDLFGRFVQPSCASSKPKIYIVSLHSLWQFGLQFFPLAIMVHSILHSLNLSDTPKWTIMAISFHHYKSLGWGTWKGWGYIHHLFFLRVEMLIPWNEWGFHSGAWHCNGVFSQLHGHRLGAQKDHFNHFGLPETNKDKFVDLSYVPFKHVHTDKHRPFAYINRYVYTWVHVLCNCNFSRVKYAGVYPPILQSTTWTRPPNRRLWQINQVFASGSKKPTVPSLSLPNPAPSWQLKGISKVVELGLS